MKIKLLFFLSLISFCSIAQKEFVGTWDLQYLGTPEDVKFDINDSTILFEIPRPTGVTVNFETEDEDLNDEMNANSYHYFSRCWIRFVNKKKILQSNLVIINGIFQNEIFRGKYYMDENKKKIRLDLITKKTKVVHSSSTYTYEIKDDLLTLTGVKNPDFTQIFKKRSK